MNLAMAIVDRGDDDDYKCKTFYENYRKNLAMHYGNKKSRTIIVP
jgi:hypothetical protein